jgi:UDP-N-acetylglucosamine diphosphorylase / glucose-1-phosphate thymidylyltransferase / UDP-N-acetylgalactosamine diphosphorylase / glucosamine-1-phosphate N-acetyltransferase / galactosamine-1-phosphate N-acetyltransferase
MISLSDYINIPSLSQKYFEGLEPWQITAQAEECIEKIIDQLNTDEFEIKNDMAIHRTSKVEQHVVLKGSIIISANCFVGAHAYLRGGVFLDESVSVGPGCEIKSSFILSNSALAHFNFVGDSIVGNHVNMEAGSIICNHYNERNDKLISVKDGDQIISTGITKFGALVGDHSRIGANAVLSPGTILSSKSIVKRLELIEQVKQEIKS